MTSFELKKLRREAGISQEELARIIGTSVFTVSAWETGKTAIRKCAEIAIRATLEGVKGKTA